jgi:pilus assembly protein CpaC
VPTGQGDITIAFKPFGVTLKFTPIVQDGGLIRLKVAPEVSQLDTRQSLRLSGIEVPSLLVRRAGTTIELKDGETFAIAGLFQQDYANTVSQIPWAGDIPVLGSLFRSSRWKKQETELLILVTPRLVTASESRALSPDPFRGSIEPSAIDVILNGLALDRAMAPSGPSYPDAAGS